MSKRVYKWRGKSRKHQVIEGMLEKNDKKVRGRHYNCIGAFAGAEDPITINSTVSPKGGNKMAEDNMAEVIEAEDNKVEVVEEENNTVEVVETEDKTVVAEEPEGNTVEADADAFDEEVIHRCRVMADKMTMKYGFNEADSDITYNRLLLKATKAKDGWRPDGGASLRTWQTKAAKLETLNVEARFRREAKRNAVTISMDARHAHAARPAINMRQNRNGVWCMVTHMDFYEVFARLNVMEKKIFKGIYVGFSKNAIAKMLGIPRSRFYRYVFPAFQRKVRWLYTH